MDETSYAYKPTLFSSGERGFRLEPDAIVGEWGGATRRVAYADIVSMRFSSMKPPIQPRIDSCFIRLRDGGEMTLRSLSAKGFRPDDRRPAYTPFVAALISRVRQANPNVAMEVGQSRALWLLNVVVLVLSLLVLAAVVVAVVSGVSPLSRIPFIILMLLYLPSLWRGARGGPPKPFDLRGLAAGAVPSESV